MFLLRENFVAYLNQTGIDADGRPTFSERGRAHQLRPQHQRPAAGERPASATTSSTSTTTAPSPRSTAARATDLFQIGQVFGTNPNGYDYPDGDRPDDPRVVANDTQNIDLTSDSDDIELHADHARLAEPRHQLCPTAFGGEGGDTFNVYSNKAVLRMEGEAGNDNFVIRAFIAEDDIIANGGGDDDHFEYNINAPVSINGGTGFDTVVVIGTETQRRLHHHRRRHLRRRPEGHARRRRRGGRGRRPRGRRQFFILSTRDNVVTTVIGGLGSDTFNVAGDVTADIISQDLDGRSAVINHGTTSTPGTAPTTSCWSTASRSRSPTRPRARWSSTETDGYHRAGRGRRLDRLLPRYRWSPQRAVHRDRGYLTVSAGISSSADRRLPTRLPGPIPADSVLVSIDTTS